MKIAISIPDDVFEAAERAAAAKGTSRSALYATAVAEYLERRDGSEVTEQLNAIYATEPSIPDRWLKRASARTLARNEW